MRESARQILDYMGPGFQQCSTSLFYLSSCVSASSSFNVSIFWPSITFIVNDFESIIEMSTVLLLSLSPSLSLYGFLQRNNGLNRRWFRCCRSQYTEICPGITVCHLICVSSNSILNRQHQFEKSKINELLESDRSLAIACSWNHLLHAKA